MSNSVEYIDYESTRTKLEKFYEVFINKEEISSSTYIPFLKKSFQHYEGTDVVIGESDVKANETLLSINNFAFLQSQALKGKMFHSIASSQANDENYHSNNSTKGFLNFTKRIEDEAPHTKKVSDQYLVTKSEQRGNLIFATMEIIEIFIDILEAYKDFLITSKQKKISIDNVNSIIIVNNDINKSANEVILPYNKAFYIEKRIGKSSDNNHSFPSENTLFLSIKSFKNKILLNTFSTGDTYEKYYKKVINYDDIGNVSSTTIITSITPNKKLFSTDQLSLNTETYFEGIIISNIQGVTSYNGNPEEDTGNLSIDANNVKKHETNNKLCSIILKNFLYFIYKIKPESANIQINALLYYYKIMKCYLLNTVFVGNYLFNTKFIDSTLEDSTATKTVGKTSLFPIITDSSDITEIFSIPVNTTDIFWDKLIEENNIINNSVDTLTTDIENNIQGNNVPDISVRDYEWCKGFFIRKISETSIEISIAVDGTKNDDINRPFINYLTMYSSASSINPPLYTSDGNPKASLDKRQLDIVNILNQSNLESVKRDIKKNYQIEINKILYTIDDIFIGTDIYNNRKIEKINIYAKFEYNSYFDSSNRANLFKLEKNTYDIFDVTTAIGENDKLDVLEYVNDNGKLLSNNIIDDKYILLYYYTNHPNIDNIVVINKSINLKKTYNEDMVKIKNINKNIIFNETKINNSGRLYEIQDKEHSILNNQLIVYYIIIGIVAAIIVVINFADLESSFVLNVATGCFSTIVLLILSHYLVDIIYIEKFSNIEHFNIATSFQYETGFDETLNISSKIMNLQSNMTALEFKMARILDILSVAIPQIEFAETNNILNKIVENEKNDKKYISDNLDHKRVDAYNYIDIKKYDIMAKNTLIKCVLAAAFVLFGFYTLHFYVNAKYVDVLIFLCSILLIAIFTYYVINANRVVRTISTNIYWGKAFPQTYEK